MNTRDVMASHVSDGSHRRCPVCVRIVELDHLEALEINARMLAETFSEWGLLAEPTGFALRGGE
jgi:hypothetical protein